MEGYREKYGDIQRLDRIIEAEGDTPNRYKVSKQADVLMTITCDRCKGEATKVSFQDTLHALKPGDTLAFDLSNKI